MSNARELIEQVAQGARPQDVTEGLIEVGDTVDRDDAHQWLVQHGFKPVGGSSRYQNSKGQTGRIADKGKAWVVTVDDKQVYPQSKTEKGYIGFEDRVAGRVLPAVPSGMGVMRGLGEAAAQIDPKDYPGLQKANLAKLEAAHKALMDAYQGARRLLADLDYYQKQGGGDTFNLVGSHIKMGREVIENGGKAADAIVKVVHALRALELG